jgi:ribosomal protein S13
MKFEQLLQIYWSRGFLYGGKVKNFNINLKNFFNENSGLSSTSKQLLIKRFELNFLFHNPEKTFLHLSLDQRKIINMYLSQLSSINDTLFELIKYNLIRLYLIKTFKGRCHALGKPVRGQRTWSNNSTSYKCNRVVRIFIRQVKKNNIIEKKVESLNTKLTKKKIKKNSPKIKMVILKKKKNLWF